MKRLLNLMSPYKTNGTGRAHELPYELMTFPDGQPHIKIHGEVAKEVVVINTRLITPTDLLILAMAVDVLIAKGCKEIRLGISYLMGARMDRRIDRSQPFTLKIIANIINSLNFEWVHVFDPHSEVAVGLIDRCVADDNYPFIEVVVKDIKKQAPKDPELLLLAPDSGATKKSYELAYKLQIPMVQGLKHRDMKTGALSHFSVDSDDLGGRPVLVVDDICDGGGTFLGLAEVLKKKGAGELYLAVSHGIFSKGFEELRKYYKCIYTTDSFKDHSKDFKPDFPDYFKQIPLQTL